MIDQTSESRLNGIDPDLAVIRLGKQKSLTTATPADVWDDAMEAKK